ncbi:MAG: OmpA family protein [Spirochaetales bacterium]|nr:OmpA family protein [Spirochaetales bacterium]
MKKKLNIAVLPFFFITIAQPLGAYTYPYPIVHLSPFMAATFSFQQPDLHSRYEAAPGFLFGIGASNIIASHFYTQLFLDTALSRPQREDIAFSSHCDIVLTGGYHFAPFPFLLVTPHAGGGVVFHYNYIDLLVNPHLTAGCLFDVNIVKNTSVFFSFDTSLQLSNGWPLMFRFHIGLKNRYRIIPGIPEKAKAWIGVSPPLFSPDGDDRNDIAEISLHVLTFSHIDEWELHILDPMHHRFRSFSGTEPVPGKILWDGYSDDEELVESAMTYYVEFSLSDEFGRKTEARAVINTGILVHETETAFNVRIPSITFPPFSASLVIDGDEATTEKNREILDHLAELFSTQFGGYSIRIEGHANHLDWADPEKKKIEQEEVLLPLSLVRAEAVRDALVVRGIDAGRLTVRGVGGDMPIVPFDDTDNVWKNRRVEFIFEK